jgi:Kef-type K+ transport system membrane component KefB
LKDNIWFQSALWMALALLAAMGSLFITISAALFEIIVGAIAGNTVGLPLTPWINYIASFGAVVLTFLAGIVRWLSSPSNSIVPEGRRWLPRPGCCESP